MIRWSTILFVLLILGCDFAPTDHSHTGICVRNLPAINVNMWVKGVTYCYSVTEAYCYNRVEAVQEANLWVTSYSSCAEYCEEWCVRKADQQILLDGVDNCGKIDDPPIDGESYGCYVIPEE